VNKKSESATPLESGTCNTYVIFGVIMVPLRQDFGPHSSSDISNVFVHSATVQRIMLARYI